ncbi:MAG: 2-hydroxyacyl-CoA dehydratase family protein [Proteobacteria bacterium]|nr:2-hydroxyacyl-CoA dehydratase family protein [Pseudomonadota bacterium]
MQDLAAAIRKDLARLRERGPVIGCFPLYPPEELLHSLGLAPLVLWGLSPLVSGYAEADRHLQAFTCSVGRRLVQFVLSEGRDLLSGLLFYNACDTLRNLPEILDQGLSGRGGKLPRFRLHLPLGSGGPAHHGGYLKQEILRLCGELSDAFARPFDQEKFDLSTDLYARARDLGRELEQEAAAGRMGFAEFCETLSRAVFLAVEGRILFFEETLARVSGRQKRTGPRVMISGILPPPPAACRAMDAAGLVPASNDIAVFHRSYASTPAVRGDLAGYYLEFYSNHEPCPTLLPTADRRVERLLDRARAAGVQGLIFCGEKFCEYEYFEWPHLERRAREEGFSTLFLEFSAEGDETTGAATTRVQAFAELLESGG